MPLLLNHVPWLLLPVGQVQVCGVVWCAAASPLPTTSQQQAGVFGCKPVTSY